MCKKAMYAAYNLHCDVEVLIHLLLGIYHFASVENESMGRYSFVPGCHHSTDREAWWQVLV